LILTRGNRVLNWLSWSSDALRRDLDIGITVVMDRYAYSGAVYTAA